MSRYRATPTPPRPATQAEVNNQIERLRRKLNQQLKDAQSLAVRQATERAQALQREQIRKIEKSIEQLDGATRRNLESMDQRHREQLQGVTKRVYDDIAKAQENIRSQVNRQLANLASDVSDQLKGLDTRLQRQQRDIQAINGQMQAIVNDINNMAGEIDRRFEENERQITTIQSDLSDIRKRFTDEDELARQTAEAAKALLTVVEGRTLLDRFAPSYEAQDIRNRVRGLAETQLRGAALTAKAEETITKIWETESHAVQEKAKHDAMVEVALTQIEKVLTVVNDNRLVEQEVKGGDPMEVECNFWSNGEYGRLEEELAGLKAELEDRYNRNLTKNRIEEITRRSAEIEGRILQISAESVAKSILSEARVETLEDVVNAMEKKGWTLKGRDSLPEFGYMGGEVDHDWRKGVCAVLENNVGEEITVIIDPVSDSQNRLIVHQETTSAVTDEKADQQLQMIEQQLCDLDYQVGAPVTGVTAIPEMGSVERLGQAHATDRVMQKIEKQ